MNDSEDSNASEMNEELLGVFECRVRGIQYYDGKVQNKQMVELEREPTNPYDRNAIRVLNVLGEHVGHIERDAAAILADLIDNDVIDVEGFVAYGANNTYSIPISVAVFGDPKDKSLVRKKIARFAKMRNQLSTRNTEIESALGGTVVDNSRRNRVSKLLNSNKSVSSFTPENLFNKLKEKKENESLKKALQPKEVKTKLLPHQLMALEFMRDREKSALGDAALVSFQKRPDGTYFDQMTSTIVKKLPPMSRGGILADEMGLGKTLSTLSLIASDTDTTLPTLIVCPMAVLSVWSLQAQTHIKRAMKMIVYHGSHRDGSKLKQYDIVLTTYDIVRIEWNANTGKGTGPLFKNVSEWRRIVLDEAHYIKNRNSKTNKAICSMNAQRRWALTGTPVQNNLDDLYSLLKFLHIAPFSEYKWYRRLIVRPLQVRGGNLQEGYKRIQSLVSRLCLRRTKSDMIDGQPIISIAPAHQHIVLVPLSSRASGVYDALMKAARKEIDSLKDKGKAASLLKLYSNVLVVLLRLRQTCASLNLLPKQWLHDAGKAASSLLHIPSDEELKIMQQGVLRLQEALNDDSGASCCICLDELNAPVVTKCSHYYCRECLIPCLKQQGKCPMCREPVSIDDLIDVTVENGNAALNVPKNENENDNNDKNNASYKIKALIELIDGLKHLPRNQRKVVVFSQFPKLFDTIEDRLKHELQLNVGVIEGKTSAANRTALIQQFHQDSTANHVQVSSTTDNDNDDVIDVMLVSLRAGGVGIDLSCARFVFVLDPWWNVAVEEQAIARVHRLGSTGQVHVVRLIGKDTLEENIISGIQRDKELAFAEAFALKSAEELQNARLKLVYTLFGNPLGVAGGESVEDRVKEFKTLKEDSNDVLLSPSHMQSSSIINIEEEIADVDNSMKKTIVLNDDDDDDNGGVVVLNANKRTSKRKRKRLTRSLPEQEMSAPILRTKRARKPQSYLKSFSLKDAIDEEEIEKEENFSDSESFEDNNNNDDDDDVDDDDDDDDYDDYE